MERAFATLAGSEPDVTLSVRDMEKLWTECAFASIPVDGGESFATCPGAQDFSDWIVPEEVTECVGIGREALPDLDFEICN